MPARKPARRIGGLGMMAMSVSVLVGGIWVGSQVQAFAVTLKPDTTKIDMHAIVVVSAEQSPAFTF